MYEEWIKKVYTNDTVAQLCKIFLFKFEMHSRFKVHNRRCQIQNSEAASELVFPWLYVNIYFKKWSGRYYIIIKSQKTWKLLKQRCRVRVLIK